MFHRVIQLGDKLGLERWVRPSVHDTVLADIVGAMTLAPKDLLLDVECGRADLLRMMRGALPRFQARYVGVDRRPDAVARARDVAMSLAIHTYTEFHVGSSLAALPLGTGEAAVAVVHFVLHQAEVHDRLALLREVARVLRPGGALWVVEPSEHYDADYVVDASQTRDRELAHFGPLQSSFNSMIGYRLLAAKESMLAERLHRGVWHGYDDESLRAELGTAGFEVDTVTSVARGGLVVAAARSRPET